MIDLSSIAKTLSQRTQHRQEDWQNILQVAIHDPAFGQMTDGEILQLIEALQSPRQLRWLKELFQKALAQNKKEMPFDFLMKTVNLSSFTLRDWLEALDLLSQHAQDSGQTHDLSSLVTYLGRYGQSSFGYQSPSVSLTLTAAVQKMMGFKAS